MTRIRYFFNQEEGQFVSKPIVAGQDVVTVSIEPATKRYTVKSIHTGNVIALSSTHSSMAKAKIAAKNCLKLLGVVFHDEIRKKIE